MRFRKLIPPVSIVLFLVLMLAGTCVVRLRILEKHMLAAIAMEDEATVAQLARSFPSPVNARDKQMRTPLHWAARNGCLGLAERLLAKGARIEARNCWSETPLLVAVRWGQEDVARLLVAAGADVNTRKNSNSRWVLHYAADGPSKEIVGLLLGKGADVACRDSEGRTPLHYAARQRVAAENVRLLIARGAQVDARDEGGATPLHLAAQFGNEGVARALIAAGADINAHDNGLGLDGPGLTPLDYADASDRASMVELLRKAGAKESNEP